MHHPAPAPTEPCPEHGGSKTVRQSYGHEEAGRAEVWWSWKETQHKPGAAPPSGAGGNSTCTNSHNFPSLELRGRFMSVCLIIMLHNLHIESHLLDALARLKTKQNKKLDSLPRLFLSLGELLPFAYKLGWPSPSLTICSERKNSKPFKTCYSVLSHLPLRPFYAGF